jgi:imidazolonepropionase-like amidohydrolase
MPAVLLTQCSGIRWHPRGLPGEYERLDRRRRLGCIAPGALADILVVDGGPLKNIELLAAGGEYLRVIMRAGELVRNELQS